MYFDETFMVDEFLMGFYNLEIKVEKVPTVQSYLKNATKKLMYSRKKRFLFLKTCLIS